MVEIRTSLPEPTNTTTTIATEITNQTTTLEVADASGFSVNDFILLEPRGHEYCELKKVVGISNNTITVDSTIIYPHKAGQSVTKLDYDTYRIEYSEDNNTWTTLTSGTLDYSNPYQKIIYEIESWSNEYYYRTIFINSVTSAESAQTSIQGQNNYGWVSIEDLKNELSLSSDDFSDQFLSEAVVYGVDRIRDVLFNTRVLETTSVDRVFDLDIMPLELADYNADGEINIDDFYVYEVDNEDRRTYIPHLVSQVFIDSKRIIFSEDVPRNGQTLIIQVPVTFRLFSTIKSRLRNLNKLHAMVYILTKTPINKFREGISSWTAGGTSINFDGNNVFDIIEKLNEQIGNATRDLQKIYAHTTPLRTRNSMFRRGRGRFEVRTPNSIISFK